MATSRHQDANNNRATAIQSSSSPRRRPGSFKSALSALVGDHLAVIGERCGWNKLDAAAEPRDSAQRGGDGLAQLDGGICAFGLQRHDVGFTIAAHHETKPPKFWMLSADL